jgi:hypothetical protein
MEIYEYFLELSLGMKLIFVVDALGAYALLTWALAETFSWADLRYRAAKFQRDVCKNKEIDARVDEYLANHAKRRNKERALSSTCAEHLALNQKVPGSNPGGLTILGNGDFDVKRRITWYLEERTAVAMSDGDTSPTKFRWADLPRPKLEGFGMSSPSDTRPVQIRDFREDENKVLLLWDGIQTDEFRNEVILKQFIIRLVYGIANGVLVPSELLADANLVYKDDWVDEWGCTDRNDEIIECPRDIFRPVGRNIQLMRGNWLPKSGPQFVRGPVKPRIHAFVDRREIPAIIEIPDEKCFYTFRAGGFYEKDQKPVKSSCEKGEKAV